MAAFEVLNIVLGIPMLRDILKNAAHGLRSTIAHGGNRMDGREENQR
jgi:hypothetical protein